jgi:hypothetical protein
LTIVTNHFFCTLTKCLFLFVILIHVTIVTAEQIHVYQTLRLYHTAKSFLSRGNVKVCTQIDCICWSLVRSC